MAHAVDKSPKLRYKGMQERDGSARHSMDEKGYCALKTFFRYIMSFLMIALICIFTITIGARVLYGDYSRRQAETQAEARLEAFRTLADSRVSKMLSHAQQLADILDLAGGGMANEMTLATLLNNYERNAEIEGGAAFFLRAEPQYIYTDRGKVAYVDCERQWDEIIGDVDLSKIYSSLMMAQSPRLYRAFTGNRLIFVAPLGNAWSSYPAALLLQLEDDFMQDCWKSMSPGAQTGLYLIGVGGDVLLERPGEGQPAFSAYDLCETMTSGVSVQETTAGKQVFLRAHSETGLATYVLTTPEKTFYSAWYDQERRLGQMTVLSLAVAAALSVAMGFVNYLPLRKAYTQIRGEKPTGWQGDALENIVNSFEETRDSLNALEERLDTSLGTIRRQLMLALINNTLKNHQEFEDYKESLAMRLDRPNWLSIFAPIPPEENGPEWIDNALVALEDLQLSDVEMLFAECRWERGLGILANFDASGAPAPEEIAARVFDQLRRYTTGVLVLGVGSIEHSPMDMGASFYRATTTVKAALPRTEDGVLLWKENRQFSSLCLDTTLLAEAITFGNAEVALTALNEMMIRLRASSDRFPVVRLMCCDVVNTVVRYAEKQGLPANSAKLCAALEFASLDEFYEKTGALIRDVCAAASARHNDDSAQDRSYLISFLTKNYKRNDLSLKLVSDETGMSMSKINMQLKEKLGCSFVQYVSLLRMNEVKRLLRETDESVQSIVQAVGYIDISSFIRKFRKMEGLSPSQYRQMHRK